MKKKRLHISLKTFASASSVLRVDEEDEQHLVPPILASCAQLRFRFAPEQVVSVTLLLVSVQVSTKEAVFGSITSRRTTTTIQTPPSTSYVRRCNHFTSNTSTLNPPLLSQCSDLVIMRVLNAS